MKIRLGNEKKKNNHTATKKILQYLMFFSPVFCIENYAMVTMWDDDDDDAS